MIHFQNGLRSARLAPEEQKRFADWLQSCDRSDSELYMLNQTYNQPWHMGGIQYLEMDTGAFMQRIADAARDPNAHITIQGSVHTGDVHMSHLFPGCLVQDVYIRCVFADGSIRHVLVAPPMWVA